MSDQPEALKLAGELVIESEVCNEAAAELRRLHAECDALKQRLQLHDACNGVMGERGYVPECISLRAECDALRARALKAEFELLEQVRCFREDAAGEQVVFDTIVAERDALRSELATLRAENYNTQSLLAGAEAKCDALRAEVEALTALLPGSHYMDPPDGGDVPVVEQFRRMEKDAERYRWLRVQHWSDSSLCVVAHPRSNLRLGTYCPSAEALDELADAARAALKEGK